MRKGFSLVELITVLAVIAVISIPLGRLFKFMTYDIPKSCKLVESNTSLLDVLKYIRKDINSAKSFPQSFQEYSTDANSLLIERQGSVICYLLRGEEISRIVIGDAKEKITWQIPNGKIEWQVWRKDGVGYAVEVKKCVELKSYNRVDKRMENAYVYFAGAYKEAKN
ncbi:MAG: prepilin-type N-terminal cleavage/methylation domain-containing protein [Sedimentisphaerales bacterium]